MNFKAFVEDIEMNHWNVHGVEVYQDGQLVHSYGDTTKNIYDIYLHSAMCSICKY